MFGKKKLTQAHKQLAGSWAEGYARGYAKGSREMSQFVREMIIKNLLSDAVIITNADLRILERVVEIVEES
jgi:hypothetical protein